MKSNWKDGAGTCDVPYNTDGNKYLNALKTDADTSEANLEPVIYRHQEQGY